jgi:hypothetical protein
MLPPLSFYHPKNLYRGHIQASELQYYNSRRLELCGVGRWNREDSSVVSSSNSKLEWKTLTT